MYDELVATVEKLNQQVVDLTDQLAEREEELEVAVASIGFLEAALEDQGALISVMHARLEAISVLESLPAMELPPPRPKDC